MAVYAITPSGWGAPELYADRVARAVAAGVTAVQYRDKSDADAATRRRRAQACREAAGTAFFVVNDDIDLALDVGADAVHLGPEDALVDVAVARGLLVGSSAGTVADAIDRVRRGATYLGVGAIFDAHATKPNASAPRGLGVLEAMRATPELADVPIVAIGGVTAARAGACVRAGADGVACVRDVFGAADVEDAAQTMAAAVRAAQAPRPG